MLRRVVLSNTARRAGTRFAAAATDPAGARGSEKAASSTGFGFEKGVPAAIGLASALACYTVFCYTKDDSTAVLAHERRTEVPPAALKATKSTARLAAEADGLPNDKATVGARLAVEGCQLANDQPFDSDAPSHRWPVTPGGPGITRPKDMQSNRFATKKSDLHDDKKSLEEEQEKSQPRKASKQDKADDRGIVERTKEKVKDAALSVKEKAVELKEKAFDDSEDQAGRKRSDSRGKGKGSKDELRRGDLEREGGAFEEEKAGGSLWSKTKRAFGMDTNNSAESEDREEAKDATREAEEKETSKRSARKGEVKPSRQSEDQRRTLNSLGSSADSGRRGDYGSDSARRTADETREMAIQKGRNLRRELEDARDREVTRQDKAQRERTGKSGVDLRKWEEAHRDGDDDEPSAYERMSSRLAAAKERVIGKAEEAKEKVADAKDYAADKKDEAKESIRRRADRSSKHSNDDDGESFGEDRGVIDSVKDVALSVKDKAVELKDKALGSNYYVEGDRAERASRDSRRRDYDADEYSFGEDRGIVERTKEKIKDAASSVKDKAVELKEKAFGTDDEDFEQKKLRTQRDFGRTREAVRESSEELCDRFESSRKGEKQKDAKREPVDETDESVSRLAISDNTKHPDKVLRRDPYTPKEKAYGENRPSVDYSDDKKRPPQSYEAIKAARTGMMADENDTHKDIFQRAKDGIAEATEKIFKKTDKKDSLAEGVWYNDTSKDRAEVFHRQQADPMYGRREKEGDLSELEGAGFHMDKQQDLKRLAERDPAKYLEKKRLEKKYGDDPRIRALNNAKDDDSQFFDDETREREYRREPIDEKDNADQKITKRGSEREQGIYRNDAQRSADTYRESVQGEGHSSAAPTGAGSKSKSHGNAETRRQTNPNESGRTDLTKTDDVRNVGTSYSPYPSAKDLTKADNLSLDGGARGSRDGQAMTDRAKRIQESGAREVGKVQ